MEENQAMARPGLEFAGHVVVFVMTLLILTSCLAGCAVFRVGYHPSRRCRMRFKPEVRLMKFQQNRVGWSFGIGTVIPNQ